MNYNEAKATKLFREFVREHGLDTTRDESGEVIAKGPLGDSHIYAYDNDRLGCMFMPGPDANATDEKHEANCKAWNAHRKALLPSGCIVVLDCEGEGTAAFDPRDAAQVRLVFQTVGIISRKGFFTPVESNTYKPAFT